MKFIATDSSKISGISVESGQLIFSRDDRVIYLDTDVRTSFTTFIILDTEQDRKSLISPVNGFYFIEDTKILWRRKDRNWYALNEKPEQNVIFVDETGKPTVGKPNVIYVEDGKMYQWDIDKNSYIVISDLNWEPINI